MRASAVILLLALAGCSGTAVDEAPITTSSTTSSTAPSTTSTVGRVEGATLLSLDDGLPRTGTYAFLDVTIDAAAIGHVDPRSFLGTEPIPDEQNHLFLTLTVHNRSGTDVANWPPNPFDLLLDGELTGPPDVLIGRPHIALVALDTTEMVLAYEIPDSTRFEDLTLVLAQEDRIPMHLPLTGELVEVEYPMPIGAEGSGTIVGGCGQTVDLTLLGSSVSIDLLDTPYPTTYGSRRSSIGDRFLSVTVLIENHGGRQCGGGATLFGLDSLRLYVDGLPGAPVAGENAAIPVDSTKEMDFHFVYPAEAGELALVFASTEDSREDLVVAVDVSAAPPVAMEG